MTDTADIKGGDNAQTVAKALLTAFVERRERLEEAKSEITEDIKELHAELKGNGLDLRTFNEMIKLRKLDKKERDERESMREIYGLALGVFG